MDFTSYSDFIYLLSTPLLATYASVQAGKLSALRKHAKKAESGQITYSSEMPPVSVIITCRNQARMLEKNLPSILEQDYPEFQVIVVDDCSEDNTGEILEELGKNYKHLYHTFTPVTARYVSHKKLAITLGVKAARHEWLLFTEADCMPTSNLWIRNMARNFMPSTNIVLGYANYRKESGLFNSRITYDRLIENIRTLRSVITTDQAYRGDTKNMALRKSLFLKNRGFEKNLSLKRGEETLLVNEIATPGTSRVELSLESVLKVDMPEKSRLWKKEKEYDVETRRHMKTRDRINDWFHGFNTLLLWIFYLLATSECILSGLDEDWIILGMNILLMLFVLCMNMICLKRSTTCIGERSFIPSRIYLEPMRALNNVCVWLKWLFISRKNTAVNKKVIQNG